MNDRIDHSIPADFLQVLNAGHRVVHNTGMNDPQPIDLRRRIRELQSIPERDRTDEQWDELNELEIRTAPGNRESDRSVLERPSDKRPAGHNQGRRPDRNQGQKNNGPRTQEGRVEGRPPESRQDGRPPKRQHRRPKRPPVETPGNS